MIADADTLARRRPLRAFLILIAVLAVLTLGAYLAWRGLIASKRVLTGEKMHNFGALVITDDAPARGEHTFRLRNDTRSTILLEQVLPSCGCTKATTNTATIEPGEELLVHATIELVDPGGRHSNIKLVLNHDRIETLFLYAVARHVRQLQSPLNATVLFPNRPNAATVFFEVPDSNDPPPPPTITVPPMITADFAGWRQQKRHEPESGVPAKWFGQITLHWDGLTPFPPHDQSLLEVVMPGDHRVVIELQPGPVTPTATPPRETAPAAPPADR